MTRAVVAGSELVLVIGDDPLVGEAICVELDRHGCRALHTDDPALALRVAAQRRPAVVVVDQIVETPESWELLRALEALGDDAPWVVLLRYAPGPTGPFASLPVTVVAGERWFEELPGVVSRHVYARAW